LMSPTLCLKNSERCWNIDFMDMNREKKELLEEARQLELNVSELYRFYADNYAEDKDFWSKIEEEERGHAALIDVCLDFSDKFPKDMVSGNLGELKQANKDIKDTIEKYRKNPPPREEAYKYAISLENSANELHYQELATDDSASQAVKTFQRLNADDKDHAERITKLLSGV